jgi:hypothetical protein
MKRHQSSLGRDPEDRAAEAGLLGGSVLIRRSVKGPAHTQQHTSERIVTVRAVSAGVFRKFQEAGRCDTGVIGV